MVNKIQLTDIVLDTFECVKDKYNRIANGINQGRAVYHDSDNQLYYKIFHPDYCRIDNFRMAIEANFFDGLAPALTDLIYDKDLLVGYVTKEGPLLSANEFDYHLIPKDFFSILKNRIKESGMFFYDLVPHNIVMIDNKPSLIDLESVYDIKDYNSISKHNAKVKPDELDNFVKELNSNMKKNVVFIPNIDLGNKRATPYHYSVKSWKHWCDKNDVLLLEWTEPIMDPDVFPIIMQREWVFDILEHNQINYDQVLIVDADTIVHPDCPNFFKETNHEYSAVVNNGCYEWVTRSVRDWGSSLFPNEQLIKTYNYFNTGFIIANEKHKPFFDSLKELYMERGDEIQILRDKIKASTGQTIVNFMLQKHNIKTTVLSEAYNLQDLFKKSLIHIPGHSWYSDDLHFLQAGWIYHFNAIPPNDRDVSYWMERTYKELYD
jgi:hypothetical protein